MSEPTANSGGTVANLRPWKPGQSGNPAGRPKKLSTAVRELCGNDPTPWLQALLERAENPKTRAGDAHAIYRTLLEFGYGKAPQFAAIEGADPLEQDAVSEAISGLVAQLRETKVA